MKDKLTKRIQRAIDERVFPGCVIGVVWKDGERIVLPFGRYTYEISSTLVTQNTMYDLASVTKSIPTFSLLLSLVDKGEVGLDDPLVRYLPEFNSHQNKKDVLIRHLLTFTLDMQIEGTSTMINKTPDEILNIILTAPLRCGPGARYLYSDSTGVLAGLLVARVARETLDVLAERYFFKSLNMDRTTFHPEEFDKGCFAPTEINELRGGNVQGEVHDHVSLVLHKKYIVGKAGLFSTVPDLLNFLGMLLNEGETNGVRYFSQQIVREMHTEQIPNLCDEVGLGWQLHMKDRMGKSCSKSTFGRTGFTGTQVICDPEHEIAVVFLSNRTYPKTPSSRESIRSVWRDISGIVCAHSKNK